MKRDRLSNRMKTWSHLCGVGLVGMLFAACALAESRDRVSPSLLAESARSSATDLQQGEPQGDPLDRLRDMLSQPGPDGQTARESAVARLLAMPSAEAHRLLMDRLRLEGDLDGLRLTILDGLRRQLLVSPSTQFGGAAPELRRQLLTGYIGACAPLWANAPDVADEGASPVRAAARRALQRVPARELDAATSILMKSLEPSQRAEVLRCLADMQQTLIARTIARQLEAPEAVVRAAAQKALDLLVYPDSTIRTEAEFEAWAERYGSRSYVDLVQRSARLGPRAFQQLRDQMEQMRVAGAREFVAVHVARRTGIDWAAIQARTTSDGPAVLDACLGSLQEALASTPATEGAAAARHGFFRALLDRFGQVPDSQQPDVQLRRALLLEVAAYLIRPDEAELAGEIRSLLLAELALASPDGQVAALRGLRRFPSDQARQALVKRGRVLCNDLASNQRQLQVILDTLASIKEPRWLAPGPDAADKADWVAFVNRACRSAPERDLRERGLLLAQTLDANKRYVPEAFTVLRGLAQDIKLDTKFRSTCLIYLDAWRADEELAPEWLGALQEALADEEAGLRKQAATSLARLREVNDPRRADWLPATITALQERLLVEPDAAVLGSLVDCTQELGREPGMSEPAILALKHVLAQLGDSVEKEQEFRLEPSLRALAAIAAGAKTKPEQWLAACESLLLHQKRKGLRQVLQIQKAIELAKDVGSEDEAVAGRARRAMTYLIGAASLKPLRTDWSAEANQEEARHVRIAFGALDPLDASLRMDGPRHRVLRAAVDLASGKHQDVVQRVSAWLAEPDAAAPEFVDCLRLSAAAAHLAMNQPAEALAMVEARSAAATAEPAAMELTSRVATALVEADAARACAVFERLMRATATEDPLFRGRLLDWVRCSLRLPEGKAAAIAEVEKHAALFAAPECPEKLRAEFDQLRSQKQAP